MFTVELLPARHGDALWIEYGERSRPHRVLIDGGPASTVTRETIVRLIRDRVGDLPDGEHDFELLVVSHIDADHITGLLNLFEDRTVALRPRDVWFNGWDHLPSDVLGAKQAERLTRAIRRRRLPWNQDFGGDAVSVPDDGRLPEVKLPGGLRLTLLSPSRAELAALRPVWAKEVRRAGLVPGEAAEEAARPPDVLGEERIDPLALAAEPFSEDDSEANGASIGFLAEYEGHSVLLTGDAHASVLERGLRRLAGQREEPAVTVDAFKLPHHGSRYNLSGALLELVDCDRYLFSTDGSSAAHHPDPATISRIITSRSGARLEFNYRTEFTRPWESRRLRRRFDYDLVYPEADEQWLTVRL